MTKEQIENVALKKFGFNSGMDYFKKWIEGAEYMQDHYLTLFKKVYAYLIMYADFREHYPEFEDFLEKLEIEQL